jgi:hypothetical protein
LRSGNRHIEVERQGSLVVLTIDCQNEYFAMQLYDEISLAAANDAKLRLEILATVPKD